MLALDDAVEFDKAVRDVARDIFFFMQMKKVNHAVATAALSEAAQVALIALSNGDKEAAQEGFDAAVKDWDDNLDRRCARQKEGVALLKLIGEEALQKLVAPELNKKT